MTPSPPSPRGGELPFHGPASSQLCKIMQPCGWKGMAGLPALKTVTWMPAGSQKGKSCVLCTLPQGRVMIQGPNTGVVVGRFLSPLLLIRGKFHCGVRVCFVRLESC